MSDPSLERVRWFALSFGPVLALILCWSFGIDFAFFWATLIFLLNFIPAVGAIIATVPPVLLAAIQLDAWASVFLFAGLFVAMHILVGQVLEPKLMGDKLAVNPIAILLGLIFWGWNWRCRHRPPLTRRLEQRLAPLESARRVRRRPLADQAHRRSGSHSQNR